MARRRCFDVCGSCGERSGYYESYPRCSICQEAICEACHVQGSVQEHERDDNGDGFAYVFVTVTCQSCFAQEHAEDVAEGAAV